MTLSLAGATISIGCRCGFKLTGYHGEFSLFAEQAFAQEDWVERLRKVCISMNFGFRYSFDKLLGEGTFAKVEAKLVHE